MARGRPPNSSAIVARLGGSRHGQMRLDLMLQTLTGQRGIPEAAAALGIGRSRFCLQRQRMLQAALESLEPKTPGRPARQTTPAQRRIAELEAQVLALKVDLRAAQIREQLALLMPHVLPRRRVRRGVKKKSSLHRGHRGGPPGPAAHAEALADRRTHDG